MTNRKRKPDAWRGWTRFPMYVVYWRDIEESLPPRGVRVIVCGKGFRKATVAWYHNGVWHQPDTTMTVKGVTHWMPFPEVHKELKDSK